MQYAEERDLVRRTLNGDAGAFNSLYKRHHARILATLIGRTRNRHDAEDLMQVTFLRAYRGLSGFRGEATFSTWLMQIALNVCTTHMRSKQARRSWHKTIEDTQLGQVLFLVEIIRGRWFQSAASASCQSVSSFKSFCSASLSLGKLRKPLILRRRGSMSNSAVANQRER